MTCIPSFVTAEPGHEATLRRLLHRSPGLQGADWGREMHLRRRYGTDLFGRAGQEVREAVEKMRVDPSPDPEGRRTEHIRYCDLRYAHIDTYANWSRWEHEPAPFSERAFEEWCHTVSDPDFVATAASCFAYAWVGATAMVPGITVQPGREPTSFKELRDFLAAGQHSLFPAGVTAPLLTKLLCLCRNAA